MPEKDGKEIGYSGLDTMQGIIMEAYLPQLRFPDVADLYNRIFRSDPEVAICRNIIDSFANQTTLSYVAPQKTGEYRGEDANDKDAELKAIDFGNQVLEDMAQPATEWLAMCMSKVLFYGWGVWEAVPGIRKKNWKAPNDDPWQSAYDDGRIGIRRLAFRNYSSFLRWDLSSKGYVKAFIQNDGYGGEIRIPRSKLVHIRHGDTENPEGIATLETIYRLEKIKYQLEIINGIGFEHAAGHLNVTATRELGASDKDDIRAAARAIMTAQQGNYALWPEGITGEVVSTAFQAAEQLMSAIRFYAILKLAVINMQWATIGTISSYGTYSTMADATTFFITWFNTVLQSFVRQLDTQLTHKIFEPNKADFPGLVIYPTLQATRVHKITNLIEIGQFLMALTPLLPLTPDDWQAIRRRSEFLQEMSQEQLEEAAKAYQYKQDLEYKGFTSGKKLQAPVAIPEEMLKGYEPPEDEDMAGMDTQPEQEQPEVSGEEPQTQGIEDEEANLALQRPFTVGEDEQPIDIEYIANDLGSSEQLEVAMRAWRNWARKNHPELAALLDAEVDTTAGLSIIDNDNGQ